MPRACCLWEAPRHRSSQTSLSRGFPLRVSTRRFQKARQLASEWGGSPLVLVQASSDFHGKRPNGGSRTSPSWAGPLWTRCIMMSLLAGQCWSSCRHLHGTSQRVIVVETKMSAIFRTLGGSLASGAKTAAPWAGVLRKPDPGNYPQPKHFKAKWQRLCLSPMPVMPAAVFSGPFPASQLPQQNLLLMQTTLSSLAYVHNSERVGLAPFGKCPCHLHHGPGSQLVSAVPQWQHKMAIHRHVALESRFSCSWE